jgi:hypothetical protein
MVYQIQPYSFKKAKQLGVEIKPSKKANKKIDVFKKGSLIASIGATGYADFPTYMKENGSTYANKRRELYKIRHSKNTGIAGQLASEILW